MAHRNHITLSQAAHQFFSTMGRVLILGLILLTMTPACSSGGPTLSGFAFGETRLVSVGEVVELRLPLREDGSRQWRVTSYDSLYLALVQRPGVETAADGSRHIVARATARRAGSTTVELTEVGTGGTKPKSARFEVRIID